MKFVNNHRIKSLAPYIGAGIIALVIALVVPAMVFGAGGAGASAPQIVVHTDCVHDGMTAMLIDDNGYTIDTQSIREKNNGYAVQGVAEFRSKRAVRAAYVCIVPAHSLQETAIRPISMPAPGMRADVYVPIREHVPTTQGVVVAEYIAPTDAPVTGTCRMADGQTMPMIDSGTGALKIEIPEGMQPIEIRISADGYQPRGIPVAKVWINRPCNLLNRGVTLYATAEPVALDKIVQNTETVDFDDMEIMENTETVDFDDF